LCAGWLVLSVAAAAVPHLAWRGGDPQAGERLARVNEEIERTERSLADAQAQLAQAQSSLRANQMIAAQPDWSIVLALLGQDVGKDVLLKTCSVRPSSGPRAAPAPRADARRTAPRPASDAAPVAAPTTEAVPYVLEASGLAEDNAAANDFVLRLEKSPIFSRVTLLDTAGDTFLEKNRVNFRLECVLGKPGKGAPQGGAQAAAPSGGATGSDSQ
jgi:hypothetical protein